MSDHGYIRNFFFPSFDARYCLRVLVLALLAFIFFRHVASPFYIHGDSMAPTYKSGRITFGFRLAYLFSEPERGDIVILRIPDNRNALLKRIIGLPGETVEFEHGDLLINGEKLHEPYMVKPSVWNLEPEIVAEGYFYVVGDNRSTPHQEHVFGQLPGSRVIGRPVW